MALPTTDNAAMAVSDDKFSVVKGQGRAVVEKYSVGTAACDRRHDAGRVGGPAEYRAGRTVGNVRKCQEAADGRG